MPELVRLRLEGKGWNDGTGVLRSAAVKLVDADTGKIIRATDIRVFIEDGMMMCALTCYLNEIDLETAATKITICPKCKRSQNPGPEPAGVLDS